MVEKEKSFWEKYVYDPNKGKETDISSGAASSQVGARATPVSLPPLSVGTPIAAGAPLMVASSSGGSTDDETVLKEALGRGVKRGFAEFLASYMDFIGEQIEPSKAASLAVKMLGRQGISLPEIQLAFLERIEILSNERRDFTQFIEEQAVQEVQRKSAGLENDKQAREQKLAQIQQLQADVQSLDRSIAEGEQSLSQVATKKEKRVADFMQTFQQVSENINRIKEILDKQ